MVDAIVSGGGEAFAVQADVGNEADIIAMFAMVDRRFGPLNALVNNAGIVDRKSRVDEMSAARIERMMRVNVDRLDAVRACSGQTHVDQSRRQGGAIVNISSAAAAHGAAGEYVDYAASKGAIDTFTIGLAREVATEGVRVNAVRPGIVDTDIHASGGQPGRAAAMRQMIPDATRRRGPKRSRTRSSGFCRMRRPIRRARS